MVSLMNKDMSVQYSHKSSPEPFEEDDELKPAYHSGVKQYYTAKCPKLVELVDSCVEWQADLRPYPYDLWRSIQQEVGVFSSLARPPLKLTGIPDGDAPPLHGSDAMMGLAN